jgi:TnpA family transposase
MQKVYFLHFEDRSTMPRRLSLSANERASLLTLPEREEDLIRYYSFSESDLALIRQRRGDANRLGFAVQLCLLRYPGYSLASDTVVTEVFIAWVARSIKVKVGAWKDYGERDTTRREHLQELKAYLGLATFGLSDFRWLIQSLTELAMQTDKGFTLATQGLETLRLRRVILPAMPVIERACAAALTRANRRIYRSLVKPLNKQHQNRLDKLLKVRPGSNITWLVWLRQSSLKPNSRYMLEHIERLKTFQAIGLPENIGSHIHQNRLLKMAREGGQMTPKDLKRFETQRRYATLVALAVERMATITDELIDLHDQILTKVFRKARNKYQQQSQSQNTDLKDLLDRYRKICLAFWGTKNTDIDPYDAVTEVISWDEFSQMMMAGEPWNQAKSSDHWYLVGERFNMLRRYTPALLNILKLRNAPAAKGVMEAIEVIRTLNDDGSQKIPADAPTSFIRTRWKPLIFTSEGIERRFYEICLLTELKNSLRSGDIWVQGSRQFKDFDAYLLPLERLEVLKEAQELAIAVNPDCEKYLDDRLKLLEQQLATVNGLALAGELPDVTLDAITGLKITPLETIVPEAAQELIEQVSLLMPRTRITELLMEVEEWTNFTRHFVHLKSGEPAKNKVLLMSAILADAINLGLTKMAESSPGITYEKLSWLQAWYIRDDTYAAGLKDLVDSQFQQPFAENWGEGTTSSSDGQRFRASGRAESTGHVNPKYGSEPGRTFYTHISDQYSPFSVKVINVGLRDSTYVLDGLLYHESDLRIEEHYTDTAGFTDHVFALMHLLGFRFAPRIRGLKDTKLYVPKNEEDYSGLQPIVGGTLNLKQVREHWNEIIQLAASIKHGTVTASLMLRKLGSYPRQNGLSLALRELGRLERTLFILEWLQSVDLRRRVNAGLNKGEARNALARAVFFNRLGEIRDQGFEQQCHRASGLNLVTAAIVRWNTVYIERAVEAIRQTGQPVDENLLKHLSPLGWEHINLTGDYVWQQSKQVGPGKFRPLRSPRHRTS